jgi:hypothetical protein
MPHCQVCGRQLHKATDPPPAVCQRETCRAKWAVRRQARGQSERQKPPGSRRR